MRRDLLAFKLFCLLAMGPMPLAVMCSNASDSVRFMLETDASPQDRAGALIRLAARRSSADPKGALGLLREAERIATDAHDGDLAHEALLAQGNLHARLGQRAEHLEASMRALRIAQRLSKPAWIALDLQGIARAYRLLDEPERAIKEARNALAVALQTDATEVIHGAELLLVEALVEGGDLAEAQRVAERALGDADEAHGASIRLHLARGLLRQARPFDAKPLLVAAQRSFERLGDERNAARAAIDLARTALQLGQVAEARANLDQVQSSLSPLDAASLRLDLMKARHELASAKGDFKMAHEGLLAINAYVDSIRKAEKELLLSGMHAMHDAERRELDNQFLRAENARQETLIAEGVRSRHIIVFTAAALGIIALLLLWVLHRYRRAIRRSRLKSTVIARQRDELEAKSLELHHQNLRLRESLLRDEQKDLVIHEIHHRVKNNLQAIDAVLSLSMDGCADQHAHKALREARGRLRAMALVHAAIHRNGTERDLPLQEHFEELSRQILVAHGLHASVSLSVQADRTVMDAAALLPLSLLVNELITNSIKHAFGNERHGRISLSLTQHAGNWTLQYADGGPGPIAAPHAADRGSVGIGLMRSLAEQLNGTLEADPNGVRLRFATGQEALRMAS